MAAAASIAESAGAEVSLDPAVREININTVAIEKELEKMTKSVKDMARTLDQRTLDVELQEKELTAMKKTQKSQIDLEVTVWGRERHREGEISSKARKDRLQLFFSYIYYLSV